MAFTILKFIGVISTMLLAGFTMYFALYFSSYKFQLCEPIHNCTYDLEDIWINGANGKYCCEYDYVFNDKYRCSIICDEVSNKTFCPQNGSQCHLTQNLFDYCQPQYYFSGLISCRNFGTQIISLIALCMWPCIIYEQKIVNICKRIDGDQDDAQETPEEDNDFSKVKIYDMRAEIKPILSNF